MVDRHDRPALDLRLGHEHPIERIAVMRRERRNAERMVMVDRENTGPRLLERVCTYRYRSGRRSLPMPNLMAISQMLAADRNNSARAPCTWRALDADVRAKPASTASTACQPGPSSLELRHDFIPQRRIEVVCHPH